MQRTLCSVQRSSTNRQKPVLTDGQLVGEFATRVQERLRDRLAATRPRYDWTTEHSISSTPVDIAGTDGDTVAVVELEWRRADPADNTAKLFRHLSSETLDADRVVVCQLFTNYYSLASGGVSSKRANAEFVGSVAAETLAALTYRPLTLPLDPPKRGGSPPDQWRETVDDTAETVTKTLP